MRNSFSRLPTPSARQIIFPIALLLCLCPLPAARAEVNIAGHVLAQDSGAPTPGAIVSLYPTVPFTGYPDPGPTPTTPALATTRSLADGSYALKAPTAGNFRLTVTAAGYGRLLQPVNVPTMGLPALDLFVPLPLDLELHLADEAGNPAKAGPLDAHIWFLAAEGTGGMRDVSGTITADGSAHLLIPGGLPFIAHAKILVALRAPGAGWSEAKLDGWPHVPVKVTLHPGGAIKGQLLDVAGKPVPLRTLFAMKIGPDGEPITGASAGVTGQDGGFLLPDLEPGRYALQINPAPGYVYGGYSRLVTVPPEGVAVTFGPQDQTPPERPPWHLQGSLTLTEVLNRVDPERAKSFVPIRGKVIDGVRHTPLAGVTVILGRSIPLSTANSADDFSRVFDVSATITGADGSYLLRAPAAGDYKLNFDPHYGYDLSDGNSITVTLPPGGLVDRNISLTPVPLLKLKLVGVDGKPVVATEVTVVLAVVTKDEWSHLITESRPVGADGMVSLAAPDVDPDKLVAAMIVVRDSVAGTVRHVFHEWPHDPLLLNLQPGETLHGTLTDTNGKPVAAGYVQASYVALAGGVMMQYASAAFTASDAAGHFSIPALLPGVYKLSSYLEKSGPISMMVQVPPPASNAAAPVWHTETIAEMNQTASAMGYSDMARLIDADSVANAPTISGRIVSGPDSKPAPDLLVFLQRPMTSRGDYSPFLATARTAADGTFTLQAPSAGQYVIGSDAMEDYSSAEMTINLPPGGVHSLRLELTRLAVISLHLIAPNGQPLASTSTLTQPGVSVFAYASSEKNWGAATPEPLKPDGTLKLTFPQDLSPDTIRSIKISLQVLGVGCARIELDAWPAGPVPAELQPGATISGTVIDAAGAPIRNIRVTLMRVSHELSSPNLEEFGAVWTGDNGIFEMKGLIGGAYVAYAQVPNEMPRSQLIVLPAGGAATVTLKPGERL